MIKRSPSSSFVTDDWTYHVFLSFRGVDTRSAFTNNLHQALARKGIRSFIDHEDLKVGEEISLALEDAINGSRIGIIIFSENYASSTFCLKELVQILKYIKGKGRLVWPIFYKVDPCNVRHLRQSYKEAFDNLKNRFGNNNEEIKKWKMALHKAANLKGEHFTGNEYESDFIERIVQQVSRIINRKQLYISVNYPVDLDSRVQKVISLFYGEYDEDKCMVGISGIGGIGKSTIARAVFNSMADQFENLCFLPNVRENSIGNRGLVHLQQTLISETLGGKKMEFIDVHKGIEIIKDRLQQKKVLLVLDDIDKLKQLQTLAGGLDWFGPGSNIIITTRDKHLVRVHGVKRIYEVEGLNNADAYELFCWNAFKKNEADPRHMNISMRAVHYCKGLPLALDIIGCNLFGKEIEECESALDAYERILNKEIQEILKVSYDGLEEDEKVIFLDMACFFKGYKLKDAKDVLLNGRGVNPEYAISVLVEKSLIKTDPKEQNSLMIIDPNECIVSMHDLILDMGRQIVRQESNLNPGNCSRLWCYKDILDVLQENKGTDKNEFIMLDMPDDEEVEWDGEAFKDMKNLKVLIVRNACFSKAPRHLPNSLRILDWRGYPSSSLPIDFYPRKLVILNLTNCLLALNEPLQKFKLLTDMDISKNTFLRQIPDVSGLPNLRRLNFQGCINLTEVHDSVGGHDKIRELYASGCSKLRIFPRFMKSECLNHLDLSGCLTLQSFPSFFADDFVVSVYDAFDHSSLSLQGPLGFARLNSGISMFSKLDRIISESGEGSSKVTMLVIRECSCIDEVLTTYFSWFATLEVLILYKTNLTDEFLFTLLPRFHNLTELDLTANDFTTLPVCINQCCFLRRLLLDLCYELREIRRIPSSIKQLSAVNCISLTSESLSVLSSEKLQEGGGTDFILPGLSIPNWFDHRCKGSSLSFWFRKKPPLVAVSLVYGANSPVHSDTLAIQVHVNRHEIGSQYFSNTMFRVVGHLYLFDLRNKFQPVEAVKEYMRDTWNHAELKLVGYVAEVECMGVYIYKQNHDMEDVRFTIPRTGYKRKRGFIQSE